MKRTSTALRARRSRPRRPPRRTGSKLGRPERGSPESEPGGLRGRGTPAKFGPGGVERCFGSPGLRVPASVRSVVLFVAAPGTGWAESVMWAGHDYCTPCRPLGPRRPPLRTGSELGWPERGRAEGASPESEPRGLRGRGTPASKAEMAGLSSPAAPARASFQSQEA